MKHILKLLSILLFILLISACQKQQHGENYKKEVAALLESLDTVQLKDINKGDVLDSLSRFLLDQKNDSINRNLLFKVISKYHAFNKNHHALEATNKAYERSLEGKDSSHIAKSLLWKGTYQLEKFQYDSAFSYYSKSKHIYTTLNDTLMQGWTTMLKGNVLYEIGNFAESETECVNALYFLSKTNRKDLLFYCYNTIGLSLKGLNNYKNSLAYFKLALKQVELLEKDNTFTENLVEFKAYTLNNMGWVYESLENYPEAIRHYNLGLQIKDLKQIDPEPYAMLLDNLAHAKMQVHDYKTAYNALLQSLQISKRHDFKPIQASNTINLGEYYLLKKDTAKAFSYIKDGLALSQKIKYNELTLKALKFLSEHDFENKTHYTKLYIKFSDSLQNAERATRDKFARIEYETQLIEKENQSLSKQNTYILILLFIIVLAAVFFIIIFRLKTKNKELLFAKEQQEANEKIYQLMLHQQAETEVARNEERNRIAMELHDGIVNRIFTTRFNLMQLEATQTDKKTQLVQELERAEDEIRRVSHDLQQNLLFEDKNLPEIITQLIAIQNNDSKTTFDWSIDKQIDWSKISSNNKIHIYRIIQEALQNINKYSKASKAVVFLLKSNNQIILRIWDNGIGFDRENIKYGIGLKNIQKRTQALNGELKITSQKRKGTTIEIVF